MIATGLVALGPVTAVLIAAPPVGPAATGGLCLMWGTQVEVPRDVCDRVSTDSARRGRITETQRADAETAFTPAARVLSLLGNCFTDKGLPCRREHEPRPPAQADADRLIRDASAAGFDRTSARVADNDDPAPVGSLLYAIQIDDHICIVGYLRQVPSGLKGHDIVGTLPHGNCLDS
ncbi:hypothetical protein ACQPZF_17005 [Actinosynnema sp. CS-041913]|uniref:hypothetical protein n=1 Tax=Actinosynnema sp. CS-041913 TaxID=3239917 RepID=UPI003D8FB3FD